MERQSVISSNVRSIAYDSEKKILEVEFHRGGRYQYRGVPQGLHDRLMASVSKGTFMHEFIKGEFPYTMV